MTALNGQQFAGHHQLTMFERTQDVIDKVDKIDAGEHVAAGKTPREQWEHPLTDPYFAGESIRDFKLHQAMRSRQITPGYDILEGREKHNLPPLRIDHNPDNGRMELGDGHHRLAVYEAVGDQEVPVWHSFDPMNDETPHQWRQPHKRPL